MSSGRGRGRERGNRAAKGALTLASISTEMGSLPEDVLMERTTGAMMAVVVV